ncbi:MAG TPA: hypothetical protein VL494_13685 [Steroidobacteraceae bacterium]|jgi:hypothetical protein|nr:hypothetical protein [Steroidobacteraceae bacterium]
MSLESDSLYQRLGGLELPVFGRTIGQTGLASLDPSRDLLLDLFTAAINSELGEAWTTALGNIGGQRENLGQTPVSDTFADEPTEQNLRQRKGKWPLLAIHRAGNATYESFTFEITRCVQPWALHYILGPLDIIDARQLKDICVAVSKIVALVIRRRGHASFQGGALQFFGAGSPDQPSPLTSLRLISHEGPGQAVFGGAESTLLFWAIEMRLESTEISSYVDGAQGPDLDGLDVTVGVGSNEILPAVIIAASDSDAASG